jgi:hypothetical protein
LTRGAAPLSSSSTSPRMHASIRRPESPSRCDPVVYWRSISPWRHHPHPPDFASTLTGFDYSTIIPNSTKFLDSAGMNTRSNSSRTERSSGEDYFCHGCQRNRHRDSPACFALGGHPARLCAVFPSCGIFRLHASSEEERFVARPRKDLQQTVPTGSCSGNANTIQLRFTVSLANGISLTGEDDFCPTFSLNLQISSFMVSSLNVQVSLWLQPSLGLQVTAQGSFVYPYTFKTLAAGPYKVLVGDVPVVFQPTLTPFGKIESSRECN